MPDLRHMFQDSDLDFLSRVARFWGVDLPANSFQEALESLAANLNNQDLVLEVMQALPLEAQSAWKMVCKDGRVPAAQFTRKFGELRILGEGWRKREEPDLHPVSVTEMLWYRGFIGRGIFGKAGEPQEYLYVPDEWLVFFRQPESSTSKADIRPANNDDQKVIIPADSSLIDRMATLLAEVRKDPHYPFLEAQTHPVRLTFEQALLESAGLISAEYQVQPEKSREILEKEPGAGMLFFFDQWLKSEKINDLRMLPGLIFEGNWDNPVDAPRNLLFGVFQGLEKETWWSLPSLIADIKNRKPDFQRAVGDFDSWFIRRKSDDQYLQGFDAWDEVEGYLIRYLVSGPLHWLGLVDLGSPGRGKAAASFRISPVGANLLSNQAPELKVTSARTIKTTSVGSLHIPAGIQAALHYQTARFCHLEKQTPQETMYSVTLKSLKNAVDQGLKPTQLGSLLKRAGVVDIPPGFTQLLERFEKYGVEAKLERATLLTVERPELLQTLFTDNRSSRFLGELISPQVARVKPGCEDALLKILREMGRLAEVRLDV